MWIFGIALAIVIVWLLMILNELSKLRNDLEHISQREQERFGEYCTFQQDTTDLLLAAGFAYDGDLKKHMVHCEDCGLEVAIYHKYPCVDSPHSYVEDDDDTTQRGVDPLARETE